jgi:hypothetical protein
MIHIRMNLVDVPNGGVSTGECGPAVSADVADSVAIPLRMAVPIMTCEVLSSTKYPAAIRATESWHDVYV